MSDTSGAVSAALSDGSPSTPESAQSALEALQSNAEWSEKFLGGDPAAAAKFHELSRIIAGAPPAAKAPAAITAPKTADEARAALTTLQNDPAWAAKFLSGDEGARREFARLVYHIAEGVPAAAHTASAGGTVSPATLLSAADGLAEIGFDQAAIDDALTGIKDIGPQHVELANRLFAEATGNAEWMKRYLAGGVVERRQMTAINTVRSQWELRQREASAR